MKKEKRKWQAHLISILEIILATYVILLSTYFLNKNMYGYTEIGKYTIITIHSKEENIELKKNDLVIFNKEKKLKKNEILYYYTIVDETYKVRSDKIKSLTGKEKNTIYTIGENDLTISQEKILGKKVLRIPTLGFIINLCEEKIGFFTLIILPIIIFMVYHLIDLCKLNIPKKEEKGKVENEKNKGKKHQRKS